MNNEMNMSSDGINLYVNLKVIANKTALRILGGFMIFMIILFVTFAVKEAKDINTETGIFMLIGVSFFLYLPIKYLLWNIYGEEDLIINTSSISYSHDYGWFKTNLETIEFNALGITLDQMRLDGKSYLGQVHFTGYDKDTKVPEIIYSTTIFLNMNQIQELQIGISSLFKKEYFEDRGFIPFSLN